MNFVFSQINHPNIIHIFGFIKKPLAIVCEYVNKGSLYDVLHVHGERLSNPVKLMILKEIVSTMNALHNCNPKILHLRLKSRNILVIELNNII
jgi:serine/threonine protein kinase